MKADPLIATGPRVPALPRLHVTEYESGVAAPRGQTRRHDLAAVVLTGPENIHHLPGPDHLGRFALTLLMAPFEGQPVVVARKTERHTLRAQVPHARHAGVAPAAATHVIAATPCFRHASRACGALLTDAPSSPPSVKGFQWTSRFSAVLSHNAASVSSRPSISLSTGSCGAGYRTTYRCI